MDQLGKRLRRLREQKKLTIKEVAQQLGVPSTTYREWEYGRNIKGSRAYLSLSKLYGIGLNELLTGKAPPNAQIITEHIVSIQGELELLREKVNSLF